MKLWVFGCSHAVSRWNLADTDPHWTSLVADYMGLELVNCAAQGASNDTIFEQICAHRSQIQATDQVIVLFTHPERVIYDGEIMIPGEPAYEWWYKNVHADDIYYHKLLHVVLATKHVLTGTQFRCTFVDPTLLMRYFRNADLKSLLKDHIRFLPKVTLFSSFGIGDNNKHLNPAGHLQLADFFNLVYVPR
jgi:hypothetical protein